MDKLMTPGDRSRFVDSCDPSELKLMLNALAAEPDFDAAVTLIRDRRKRRAQLRGNGGAA